MQTETSILDQIPTEVSTAVAQYISHLDRESATGDIRPWGGYIHLRTSAQQDEKIIWVAPGNTHPMQTNALSLQLHGVGNSKGHNEEWIALTDITLIKGNSPIPKQARVSRPMLVDYIQDDLFVYHISSGQSIGIDAGVMHALLNPHQARFAIVKETRKSVNPESDADARELDIVRVLDHTRRDGAPSYSDPEWEYILQEVKKSHEEFTGTGSILQRKKIEKPQQPANPSSGL